MHCNDFCDRLDDLLDERADVASDPDLVTHMRECGRCANYFAVLTDALNLIESPAFVGHDEEDYPAPWRDITEAALLEFRQPAFVVPKPWHTNPVWRTCIAAAAVLLLGVSVSHLNSRPEGSPVADQPAAEQVAGLPNDAGTAQANQPESMAVAETVIAETVIADTAIVDKAVASSVKPQEGQPTIIAVPKDFATVGMPSEDLAASEEQLAHIGQIARVATQGSWQLMRETPGWTDALRMVTRTGDEEESWLNIGNLEPLARTTGEAMTSLYSILPQQTSWQRQPEPISDPMPASQTQP